LTIRSLHRIAEGLGIQVPDLFRELESPPATNKSPRKHLATQRRSR
jgi:hypothetical protein